VNHIQFKNHKDENHNFLNMAAQVALIFGYGPRVGFDVARMLAVQGYKVAVVSRSEKHQGHNAEGYLKIQADLSDPSSVERVYTRVIEELGHPGVVVYNGTCLFHAPDSLNIQRALTCPQPLCSL